MDKKEQSVMDEFVNRHNGVNEFGAAYFEINGIEFTSEQFNQRALELGWVSGFKWGVEYPTNGKKPDLPDDVLVDIKCETGANKWQGNTNLKVSGVLWRKERGHDIPASHFRIVDERYKPKDPESKTVKCACIGCENKATHTWSGHPTCDSCGSPSRLGSKPKQPESQTKTDNSWHERGERPPVGTECEVYNHEFGANAAWDKCTILWVGKTRCVYESESCCERFAELLGPYHAEFRPIKTEREKFVDAGIEVAGSIIDFRPVLGALFDSGCRFVSQESIS